MGRLVVAPVGEQAAGVLAPLLSPPLRPGMDDVVVLIGSRSDPPAPRDSWPWLQRVEDAMRARLGVELPTFVQLGSVGDRLTRELESRLDGLVAEREPWILVNGGDGAWVHRLLAHLHGRSRALVVAASRDAEGFTATVTNAGGLVRKPFAVTNFDDAGPAGLLAFLDMSWDGKSRLSAQGGKYVLDGVVQLTETAGMLFAVIDATSWDTSRYRRTMLARERLHALGLEERRVLLRLSPNAPDRERLRRRARMDGIAVADTAKAEASWWAAARAGKATGLPERAWSADAPPRSSPRFVMRWSGAPLAVVVGPQPGATLQAAWAHQPRQLWLLHDTGSPAALRAANRMAGSHLIPTGEARCLPVDELWKTQDLNGEVAVELRPGDKGTRALLQLWALQAPERRRCWLLSGRDSVPLDGGTRVTPAADVPLELWLELHAPGGVNMIRYDDASGRELLRAAEALAHWCSGSPQLRLAKRGSLLLPRGEPRVKAGILHLSGGGAVALADLGAAPAADFARDEGLWFEWVVAAALSNLADEVLVNVVGKQPAEAGNPALDRDELDVVTRHAQEVAYWSCKTSISALIDDAGEARAQADRLVGRRSRAVLVVPRLPAAAPRAGDVLEGAVVIDGTWLAKCFQRPLPGLPWEQLRPAGA